jgi:hypothetical protein
MEDYELEMLTQDIKKAPKKEMESEELPLFSPIHQTNRPVKYPDVDQSNVRDRRALPPLKRTRDFAIWPLKLST